MRDTGSVRSLTGLRDASSARVLNLVAIEKTHHDLPEYRKSPLFESPVLNTCLLLKHRLRTNELFLFEDPKPNATKIVIPFDKNDFRLGGTSFLYGQRGYLETLREAGKYGSKSFARDKIVLDVLNELPSLDPFLVHERLLSSDVVVADCYFELSKSDKMQMHEFVATEIRELMSLAVGKTGSKRTDVGSTARLVSALLSNGADDQLEPLRVTLMLGTDEFRQGVFSWRGFLYYKWSAAELLPRISAVAKEITGLPISRAARPEELAYIKSAKHKLTKRMASNVNEAKGFLDIYDKFYADLVQRGQPQVFRDFLLRAPHMFVELGDKLGGLAHIVSFWKYRFPKKRLLPVEPELVISLFQDFMASVGLSADEMDCE